MGNWFCGKLCYYEKSMILFRYNKTIEDEKDRKRRLEEMKEQLRQKIEELKDNPC